MATAICRASTFRNEVQSMNTENSNQLRPDLEKVVETINGLRQLAKATGYMTFKEQKVILDRLSSEDKAVVGQALMQMKEEK